jgi:hypothetical protein
VRKNGGEAAVQQLQAKVQEEIQRIESDVEQRRLHETPVRPAGQRARVRPNLI